MKRVLAIALCTLMLAGLAAGCSPKEPEGGIVDVDPSSPGNKPTETEKPVSELELERAYENTMGMVAAGGIHTLGLRTDGTVQSAGHDYFGQRQVALWDDVKYVAAGATVSLGVKTDGTVIAAGKLFDDASLAAIASWSDVFAADAGNNHAAALKNDGTVVAVGDNSKGQCDVTGWSDIVAIACGGDFTLGLRADGTVAATSGAPTEAAALTNVVKIAAGGEATVAAIMSDGTVTAYAPNADTSTLTAGKATDVACDDYGVAVMFEDGTVSVALDASIVPDPDYSFGMEDLSSVTDAVAIDVGTKHAVVMKKDGTAVAYGSSDDLQCDVGRFELRPYIDISGSYVRGLALGTTAGEAKTLLSAVMGGEITITKADDTAVNDDDIVATGMKVSAQEGPVGTVLMIGDVDGNGKVDEADLEEIKIASEIDNDSTLSGVYLRAAQTETGESGFPSCNKQSVKKITAYTEGTGDISQFGVRQTGIYSEKYSAAVGANRDTVGWITVPKTNIDYQIMFDTTGQWYYNNHTPEKDKEDRGSIYAYYYGMRKNNIVTGHNSRPSGGMFHQLHHIQEFNLGESNCANTKYCGMELAGLPDLSVYSNRVFTVYLYGQEHRYEVFSMYETKGTGSEDEKVFLDNVWWPFGSKSYDKTSDSEIQDWINNQLERSSLKFDTSVTVNDKFLTIFTCGNEHADSEKYARLYYFLKEVD